MASPYEGSYEQVKRKQEHEGRKNWMSDKNFNTVFGVATTDNPKNFIPNYVGATPSQPPALHNFRDNDNTKNLYGHFKLWK